MSVDVQGRVAEGFEAVRDAFAAGFDGKPQMGAAVAVRHRGATVVDLWAGPDRPDPGRRWDPATLSVIFSCTKGVVSVLIARLVHEGRLDYGSPVCRYWPEFAVEGKSEVTVAQLLAHRAGLSAPRDTWSTDDALDWNLAVARLAAQKPLWDPGSAYAYHAITHGWLAGELIRRVTGMSVGRYLRSIVGEPLSADIWIGLPPDALSRVAPMSVGPTLAELTRQQEADAPRDIPDWNGLAMTLGAAFPRELVGDGVGFNDPRVLAAEIPGAGGVASARALAALWSATFVPTNGVLLLDQGTRAAATVPQSDGPPYFAVPGPWPRWGMGLQLDSAARRYVTESGYGHDGAGGQVAFADPDAGIGFAYLTDQMEAIDDVRATRIIDAIREIVA